jgi:hypothetical protein
VPDDPEPIPASLRGVGGKLMPAKKKAECRSAPKATLVAIYRIKGTPAAPSCLQILCYYEGRKLTDAGAAQCREPQCHHVLGDEARPVTDGRRCALRAAELPIVFELGRIPREARQRGKIGRKKWTRKLFQYGRTRGQALRTVREFTDDKVAVFKRRKAPPEVS